MTKMNIGYQQRLAVEMFGGFSITGSEGNLNVSSRNGLASFLLLGYLYANKGNDITAEMLYDVLWPDGQSNNPGGALRTLMHRTKALLESICPDADGELIYKTNNVYQYDEQVFDQIDIYIFERNVHLAFREPDADRQYALLEQAFGLYKGDFLPMFSQQQWVMFRNNYYGNLYIKTVNRMCYHLVRQEKYAEILELCNIALELSPPTDESLHKQKIFALLNLDKTQVALDYYYSILSMFSKQHGLDITDSMTDVYEAILAHLPNQVQTLNSLDETLRQQEQAQGSFYCNFDIFQNIYRVNLRSARRAKSRFYLVLLTLTDRTQDSLITPEMKAEMTVLHEVMQRKLRTNDVYTKSSLCQYSLIINSPNEQGAQIVSDRIRDAYDKKKKHENIDLEIHFKEIL